MFPHRVNNVSQQRLVNRSPAMLVPNVNVQSNQQVNQPIRKSPHYKAGSNNDREEQHTSPFLTDNRRGFGSANLVSNNTATTPCGPRSVSGAKRKALSQPNSTVANHYTGGSSNHSEYDENCEQFEQRKNFEEKIADLVQDGRKMVDSVSNPNISPVPVHVLQKMTQSMANMGELMMIMHQTVHQPIIETLSGITASMIRLEKQIGVDSGKRTVGMELKEDAKIISKSEESKEKELRKLNNSEGSQNIPCAPPKKRKMVKEEEVDVDFPVYEDDFGMGGLEVDNNMCIQEGNEYNPDDVQPDEQVGKPKQRNRLCQKQISQFGSGCLTKSASFPNANDFAKSASLPSTKMAIGSEDYGKMMDRKVRFAENNTQTNSSGKNPNANVLQNQYLQSSSNQLLNTAQSSGGKIDSSVLNDLRQQCRGNPEMLQLLALAEAGVLAQDLSTQTSLKKVGVMAATSQEANTSLRSNFAKKKYAGADEEEECVESDFAEEVEQYSEEHDSDKENRRNVYTSTNSAKNTFLKKKKNLKAYIESDDSD